MDLKNSQENYVDATPQTSTPREKSTESRRPTSGSRSSPRATESTSSERRIKTKKPVLSLYSSLKHPARKRKVKPSDFEKLLQDFNESAIDGKARNNGKPSSQKRDVEKLTPSGSLEATSHQQSFQVEDTMELVPFTSQLLCKDSTPISSQQGSQDDSGRHSSEESAPKGGSRNSNPLESEAKAALSVLDVSDFLTCVKGLPNGGSRRDKLAASLLNVENGNPGDEGHSMTLNPLTSQRSDRHDSISQHNSNAATLTVMEERTGDADAQTSEHANASPETHSSLRYPPSQHEIESCGVMFENIATHPTSSAQAAGHDKSPEGEAGDENETGELPLPLSLFSCVPGRDVDSTTAGFGSPPKFMTANKTKVTTPKKSSLNLCKEMWDLVADTAESDLLGTSGKSIAAPRRLSEGRPPVGGLQPSTAGVKKTTAMTMDQSRPNRGQRSGGPDESSTEVCIPSTSPAGKVAIDSPLHRHRLTGEDILNPNGSGSGKDTPGCSMKKPRLDSFLEGDAELFEQLQTPSKSSQGSKIAVVALCRGSDEEIEASGLAEKCTTPPKKRSFGDGDNNCELVDPDFDFENTAVSPVFTFRDDSVSEPEEGPTVSSKNLFENESKENDPEAALTAASVKVHDGSGRLALNSNVGKDGEQSYDNPPDAKEYRREIGSDWEDFPELKSSQAALLEESAKKENLPAAANPRTPGAKNTGHDESRNSVTCIKPQPPFSNGERISTPLSSRPSGPAVGIKRKSLPASLEFAAKKPRTLPQAAHANCPLDSVRDELKRRIELAISAKKRQRVVPSPGILSRTKRGSPRVKLMDLPTLIDLDDEEEVSEICSEGSAESVTSENAVNFKYHLPARFLNTGEMMADECFLLPNSDGTAGLEEVTAAFLTSPHVDPEFVPEGWVKNHYRWIVWKLAAYDRLFPGVFGERCLTVENVLMQLKYRYDREIDSVQRSAFKKLLEGDAAPSKFVCCIASVKKNRFDEGESLFEFELTDGWYSIWAVIDAAMVTIYQDELVGVGTKLLVHGAQITNCEQGCDPLKVPANVKLKISTNSVRRVKWFVKMGFTRNNEPIPNLLCDVLPEGGTVGKLTTVVVRIYPFLYRYKDADGKMVYRNERSQAAYQDSVERKRLENAEMIREKRLKEAESKFLKPACPLKKYTYEEIVKTSDPEDLYNMWRAVGDDEEFAKLLSADQLRSILTYKENLAAQIRSDVEKEQRELAGEWGSNFSVTKLLKVRLMDSSSDRHAVLTFWRPSEDVVSALSENKAVVFYNLAANGTRDGVLQLSSTRHMVVTDVPRQSQHFLLPSKEFERVVSPLRAVGSPNFSPAFGELDTVGVVVLVKLPEQSSGVTVVCLSDLDGHYLSITFWTSLSVFGCEDLITEGSLIACSNLQWRTISSQKKKIPSVFAKELSSFTKNPEQKHLRLHFRQMQSSLANKDVAELVSMAKAHVLETSKTRDAPSSLIGSPALSTWSSPRPVSTPVRQTPMSVGNKWTPTGKVPVSASLKSTPVSSTSKSTPMPSTSKTTPTQQRLEALTRFGEEAPPLPPLSLVTAPRVLRTFKTPCAKPKENRES